MKKSRAQATRDERPRSWIKPLLVIQAVVGLLIAVTAPNALNAVYRGRTKRTMSDLRSIGTAVESYQVDHGMPPSVSGERLPVARLQGVLSPTYVKAVPLRDPWGHEFLWSHGDGDAYSILSAGKDAHLDSDLEVGATTSFDADVYYSDGSFTVYPEGTMN